MFFVTIDSNQNDVDFNIYFTNHSETKHVLLKFVSSIITIAILLFFVISLTDRSLQNENRSLRFFEVRNLIVNKN